MTKKCLITVMLLVVLLAPLELPASHRNPQEAVQESAEITAEKIIDKYIEAIGGIDAIKAIDSRRVLYCVHMMGRPVYEMERTWKRPDRMRTGPPGGPHYTMVEAGKAWRVGPDGRMDLPPSAAASMSKMADIDGPFIDSVKKGITLTFAGKTSYDMTDLYQINVTFRDGEQWSFFFDATTGLLRKKIQPSYFVLNGKITRGADSHIYYYDYRTVGSVKYPHYWIQVGEAHTHLFVVKEIRLNEDIE
jgi:hypothetical protein